jgi:hypothetical protein
MISGRVSRLTVTTDCGCQCKSCGCDRNCNVNPCLAISIWLAAVLIVIFIYNSPARSQAQGCYVVTGGTACRTDSNRSVDNGVNILEYGSDPTGNRDSTYAIQAANDYAAAENTNRRKIFCPAGVYKTTLPLFFDPPGNLRGADGRHGPSYTSGATYVRNATVNFGGVAYISLQNSNVGNAPNSSPSYWRPFAWASGTTYAQNDIVSYSGIPWISLQNGNTGNTPAVVSAYWAPTTIAPTNFTFGVSFIGDEGLGTGENNRGCTIRSTFNNAVALWVGTGTGNEIKSIQITGPSGGYRGEQSSSGIGIAIAGGPSGANRTLIENTEVDNFYTLYQTGVNSDGLGAETTFRKVAGSNCYNGIVIGETQNDINDAVEPSVSCTNNFVATHGPGISIFGGNVSTASSQANFFTISNTSSLTAKKAPGANFYVYTFTTILGSPDRYIMHCKISIGNCVYNSFVILTEHFGVVPLIMTEWNSSTHSATFQTLNNWSAYYFQGANAATETDFQNEIQEVSIIYAAERLTTFTGSSFDVSAVHLENPSACTTFIHDVSGFNGDHGITLTGVRINYDPSDNQWVGGTKAQLAWFYCQQSFPFVWIGAGCGNVFWQNSYVNQNAKSSPVIFDLASSCRFVSTGNSLNGISFLNPVMRVTGYEGGYQALENGYISGGGEAMYTAGFGGGEWDQTPFRATAAGAPAQTLPPSVGLGMVPYVGYRPAPWAHPRIHGSTYRILGSVTSSNALGSYPTINGMTIYTVLDWKAGSAKFVQSAHEFDSYGQNLTTANIPTLSWEYKGQTFAVLADSGTLSWVYPGLGVTFNSLNGAGVQHYEITGVFPRISLDNGSHAGYFTIINVQHDGPPFWLEGSKTSIFRGTTIGQDSFNWKSTTLQ